MSTAAQEGNDGHVFSVAGWCCCPALRFSLACTWTSDYLRYHSVVCFRQAVGVLQAINKEQGVFAERDEMMVQHLAQQAGIACARACGMQYFQVVRGELQGALGSS